MLAHLFAYAHRYVASRLALQLPAVIQLVFFTPETDSPSPSGPQRRLIFEVRQPPLRVRCYAHPQGGTELEVSLLFSPKDGVSHLSNVMSVDESERCAPPT